MRKGASTFAGWQDWLMRRRGCAWNRWRRRGLWRGFAGLLRSAWRTGSLDIKTSMAVSPSVSNEGYLDVALVKAESYRDLAQQAGEILGYDLQDGGVSGGFRIEFEAGGDFGLEVGGGGRRGGGLRRSCSTGTLSETTS